MFSAWRCISVTTFNLQRCLYVEQPTMRKVNIRSVLSAWRCVSVTTSNYKDDTSQQLERQNKLLPCQTGVQQHRSNQSLKLLEESLNCLTMRPPCTPLPLRFGAYSDRSTDRSQSMTL